MSCAALRPIPSPLNEPTPPWPSQQCRRQLPLQKAPRAPADRRPLCIAHGKRHKHCSSPCISARDRPSCWDSPDATARGLYLKTACALGKRARSQGRHKGNTENRLRLKVTHHLLHAPPCFFILLWGFFLPLLTAVRKTGTACAGRGQGISSFRHPFQRGSQSSETCEGS